MRYIYLLIILCCFSCNNERVLQLPEIENAEVTEVLDVSPAYIFYDETQPDSTFLNRKNLIITTNWLVNVDKRLTLKQAIPHIKFLQDKKRNAKMHKNENAKNYFTCNDTGIGNLGFLEFTHIKYGYIELRNYWMNKRHLWDDYSISLNFNSIKNIKVYQNIEDNSFNNIMEMSEVLKLVDEHSKNNKVKLLLSFNHKMTFQNYITIKSELSKLDINKIIIDTNEIIY